MLSALVTAGMPFLCLAAEPMQGEQVEMTAKADTVEELEPCGDPYVWLEAIDEEKALDWVRAQNAVSTQALATDPIFETLRERFRTIMDSDARIPMATKRGDDLYNFWRDGDHPRGILRRTTLASYRTDDPKWEVVLDVDRLAESENENWVYDGSIPLIPDYDRILVKLSRGGADANVIREFDVITKQFVGDGFRVPEAKSRVSWRDRDHLYLATDFGPDSMSTSGYPLVVKEWTRGTPMTEAHTVYTGDPSDMSVGASVVHDRGRKYEFLLRRMSFRTSELQLLRDGVWVQIAKPEDAEVETFGDWLLLELRSDWAVDGQTYLAGSLIAAPLEDVLTGQPTFEVLFLPTPTTSLAAIDGTRNYLILTILDSVHNRLEKLWVTDQGWQRAAMDVPGLETVSAWGVDSRESDMFWMTRTGFLNPSSLWLGTVGEEAPTLVKHMPSFFDAGGLTVAQHHAVSADGTRIPYFQVCRENLEPSGDHPTLLYGYGGFEVSLLPYYSALAGAGWLEDGGVYVLANIRGGGEFGPRWHQAAIRENRNKAYEDFIAVAEDLIRRGVTSARRLGIRGGSNGGLLVGNMLVQRPDLFGAVVCQVPLLDMQRYHKLLAGASWMEEYGNPDDPAQWEYLQRYSPYHQVRAETDYPRVLFMTSTRDDRVHPAHARKMVAKMKAQGHDVLYYENIEGGHAGAANNDQVAFQEGMVYRFLQQVLAGPCPPQVSDAPPDQVIASP